MKKIFIFMLVAALGFSAPACKDYLRVEPTNVLALKTYDDVKSMMGGYLRMFTAVSTDRLSGTSIPWQNLNIYMMFNLYTDDLDTDRFLQNMFASSIYRTLYTNSLDWSNPTMPGTIWDEYYLNIGFLNTVIDEVNGVDASATEKDVVRMEAKYLRALYLFKLLQYYSPYKDDRLGIPFNLNSQEVGSYDKSRKSQTRCYEIIISELQEILACTTTPRDGYNIFYNKDYVTALLAQVYHFKGGSGAAADDDYENAIVHAKAVLENNPILGLASYSPYPLISSGYGIFTNGEPKPALMTVSTNTSIGIFAISAYGDNQYVTPELYSLYKENDVRRDMFFLASNMSVIKFRNVNPASPGNRLTFNFFHSADMHLIVAESYARMNDNASASTWLESFRRERYNDYSAYTGSDLLDEIFRERHREFCLEYDMRWCDLIRKPENLSRNSYNDPNHPTYSITVDDYRWTLPIPTKEELQYNKIEQNPGWGTL